MNLIDKLFRRALPIGDVGALADFLDQQSAFVAQKGIFEYSRARSGHYSKVLFLEREFQEASEIARWRAFPLCLAMVGEVVVGVLEAHSEHGRMAISSAVGVLALAVFDRYPVPAALGEEAWRQLRGALAERLSGISLHPVKRVMDIPEPLAESYFALMPIHKKLRGQDFPTLKNYLKVTLCNVHDELTRRIDAAAVADQLLGRHSGLESPSRVLPV
jgi:hypothetical protein